MEAIILAGGLGTRLRPVIKDIPKPMAPIHGQPFLHHLMRYWKNQGITRFILSVSYKKDTIIEYFGNHFQGIPLDYAIETTPLGTGGGLLNALQHVTVNSPILLLNGDTFLSVSLQKLRQWHLVKKADLTIAAIETVNSRYGSLEVIDHTVTAISDVHNQKKSYINGGVYLIDPKVKFMEKKYKNPCSLEHNLLPTWINRNNVTVYIEHASDFIDIGIPEDYERAKKILEKYMKLQPVKDQ